MVSLPTAAKGYLDDSLAYGGILSDFTENVAECTFPQSTDTFRMMRRHAQLAAVEKAYTLPIRRATWSINPAGCRPEVVQLVADDLGLPVAGRDEPGAARTKGVTWAEHLRVALLSLPFGFSAFEMLAEMRDGKARLIELSERLPSTVREFHTDKVGRLTGISQDFLAGKNAPQIKVDRLVLYSREREGAAYWGNSILRPAYPAWFLSREMVKVLATSNRRFGMGVPVVRPLPGTNETPEQAAAAAQVAQQARVGESGGAALPPGYIMELIGQTGGSPDTLGFLRYLDHAMATQALTGFIDLGTTATGSRALASEFVDLFLLALMSEALFVADVATRQIAAKLVEWNFGDSEAVPAVQVADIGQKHELTAEALKLLLDSGALSADPGLEAQVRRMYRLPEREDAESTPSGRIFEFDVASGVMTPNERRKQLGLEPIEGGDVLRDPKAPTAPQPPTTSASPVQPEAKPVTASRRRKQADGQLALPIAATAEDDAKRVQDDYEAALAAALAAWPVLAAPMTTDLATQAEQHITAGNLAALAGLSVGAAAVDGIAAALAAWMLALAGSSASRVVAEAAAQGVAVEPVEPDGQRIGQVAAVAAALLAGAYAAAATRRALQAPTDVAAAVREVLDGMSTADRGTVAGEIGAALSTAQGQGRTAVMAAAPAAAYVGVEDAEPAGNRCEACAAAAGRRYESLSAALRDRPNGMQLAACAGGVRCRGYLRPIWR